MNKLFRILKLMIFVILSISSISLAQLVGGNTYPINGTENPPTSFANIKVL